MIKNDSRALKIVLLVILSAAVLFSGITCSTCRSRGGSRTVATSMDLTDTDRIEIKATSGRVRIEEGSTTMIEGGIRSWNEEHGGGVRTVTIDLGPNDAVLTVAPDHKLHELEVKTISGSIAMDGVSGIGDVTLRTTSGKIEADSVSITGDLEADTASGKIGLRNMKGRELSAKSTSGTLRLEGEASEEITAESVSGSVEIKTGATPEVSVKTISGSADMTSGLVDPDVHFKSVSGRMKMNGDTFTGIEQHGTGDGEIDVDTVSGSITLRTV